MTDTTKWERLTRLDVLTDMKPKAHDTNMAKELGAFCSLFRKEYLEVTQRDLAELNKIDPRNISAFENGRTTNLNYLYLYYKACTNRFQQEVFKANIMDL